MRCSCATMSQSDTSLVEEEEADVDRVYRDGAGQVGAVESIYRNLNCASLRLTIAASMAHMTWKGSDMGKGTEKWRKILLIAEEKMSLLWDTESW